VVVGTRWRFLGYDIADVGDISGLSNSGFESRELERLRPTCHAYVCCSAVAHNLLVFARALLARRRPK
jgi:hypothetical protein